MLVLHGDGVQLSIVSTLAEMNRPFFTNIIGASHNDESIRIRPSLDFLYENITLE